ncbi:Pre-mRNA-splicing factor ISY1 [Psilocybe cubensis]|uniref:Pre-mRNA-splicing factor ISY1 n=2 Tax=Psilocybe cubensis TaxID=181762 RepID=A0A8H7XRQ7_PSICU|nr:Pre-mRNA-splicing factor ISY1 [Psilocybe cubensis]KAH9474497.1 Pre-mRNA-splicing factor ISY1 [Psilocybe cubensis]
MARNEEKAQSMLYRFREAQAAELGLGTRADRRPRMASACKSLRDCERWRGEILREISRKVSKIQDAGLTDYEVRDLNDEINKLMREKRHWENQIVALGGANYRRNVAMLDDDGKEVPGTKGYKYFGRAKDLPGVRELFQSRKNEEEEENQALAFYKKFMNQGPAYYGDLDEEDGKLLEYERKAEEEDWEEAFLDLREILDLPSDTPTPKIPRPDAATHATSSDSQNQSAASSKRKAASEDVDMDTSGDDTKKVKTVVAAKGTPAVEPSSAAEMSRMHAQAAAAYIPFLDVEHLLPPKLPTHSEMEGVLLTLRKKALVDEYFGDAS